MNYQCSNVTQLHPAKDIERQAASWLGKLVSNPLSKEEITAFQTWCKINPCHYQTLLELADIWDELDSLSELAALMPIDQAFDEKSSIAVNGHAYANAIVNFLNSLWAPTVAILIITSVLFLRLDSIQPPSSLNSPTLLTRVGEKRSVVLSDGSMVTLNTNTNLEMHFSTNERRLRLLRGEAHFEVAKDPQRPFIVDVDGTQVRALGTAFNIQKSLGLTEVIVTEGIIELDRTKPAIFSDDTNISASTTVSLSEENNQTKNSEGRTKARKIKAGHLVTLTKNAETVGKIEETQLEKQLAWQDGRLLFSGETMIQVIREINRYSNRHFVFKDEATKNVRVGGYFHTGNIDEMLDVLQEGFDINVSKSHTGVIYLSTNTTREAD